MDKMYWKKIWERKGKNRKADLRTLNGYDNWTGTGANLRDIVSHISKALKIKKGDRVLEIGCGAGALAQYLECDYIGIDYSNTLVRRHIKELNNSVITGEANDIPFKDGYFDKAFSYSVFHYFPNKKYAKEAIKELKRVCKGKIFIGDLPIVSHRRTHLLFKKSEFPQGQFSEGFYNAKRFNVLLK